MKVSPIFCAFLNGHAMKKARISTRFGREFSAARYRQRVFILRNMDSVFKSLYFGKTAERRRCKAEWV